MYKINSSACPYCKNLNYKVLFPVTDMFGKTRQLSKCQNCKAEYLNPQPNTEELLQAYDDSYYGGEADDSKFEGLVERMIEYFRKKRANRVAKIIQYQGNVLDIGCGNGQFLAHLSEQGQIQIFGTEMPGNSARRAQKIPKLNLWIGELFDSPYGDNRFDAITLFHVFEHLVEPEAYLDWIYSHLKPDGHLVLSFPNIDSWQARFHKGQWLHLDPPRHLFFFERHPFIKLMQEKGFELKTELYFSIEQNPFGSFQSWSNRFHAKRELLFEHLKGNREYTKDNSKLSLSIEKLIYFAVSPALILSDAIASIFKKSATVEYTFRKI